MKITPLLFIGLVFFTSHALAISKSDVRKIVEAAYPGARITEVEKETYKGKRIYEVDFVHEGKRLEAIIELDGTILKVDIDD
ncbi:MAG: PepSY domain-containing protein [Candidatus Thiodiazotropha lotti]|uniref:PepSY domain-containing protein n=1 Tax=Candidatus Thiodiazotropha endoloripes TaxID=1818881 RepID=UPI00083E128C|nr:PepSY domain-containing protein [Candidatus Thiodiazotropha endoloripes]MCG7902066.1 PepSY domain-containing protein [Candidatus Thiodiazotropha weberae]MCG7990264.1 PepSY domain-containing protein [Candidatus Thiodiazotropha lotti]MCG7914063.1 PepSY domain-containing protein [Candidatus Thiodiazotropha weberae]MCG7999099.1 PepSY domain-containing protein [Candidatus Thiodiazotropha lotti]MCW4181918.1 PepSY domain-containing protein [Candidatus Thiodiazotropha weberae]